jgi:hypothetical protein
VLVTADGGRAGGRGARASLTYTVIHPNTLVIYKKERGGGGGDATGMHPLMQRGPGAVWPAQIGWARWNGDGNLELWYVDEVPDGCDGCSEATCPDISELSAEYLVTVTSNGKSAHLDAWLAAAGAGPYTIDTAGALGSSFAPVPPAASAGEYGVKTGMSMFPGMGLYCAAWDGGSSANWGPCMTYRRYLWWISMPLAADEWHLVAVLPSNISPSGTYPIFEYDAVESEVQGCVKVGELVMG